MSYRGISVVSTSIILMLVFIPLKSIAQETITVKEYSTVAPDTMDYIPSWYPGALEYNLMIASSRGLTTEIDRLIQKGANINSYNVDGATPLIFAVSYNQPEAVKTLLKHSLRLDEFTSGWETALMIAVKNNYDAIAEILIRAGADIEFADNHGTSPLHYAALYGYLHMVDLLLYYDATIDAKSDDGFTALHAAIWAGYADIADLLIQSKANMEVRDNEGDTPFLIAASTGDTLIMGLLYRFGVDIFARNIFNHNALTLAIAYNRKVAVEYLLEKSDKWKEKSISGYDPYKVASKYSRHDITDILNANKIPGKIKPSIDQVALSVAARCTPHDYYSGFSLSFKEPYYNAGFTLGMDMKLWYTRILREESEDNYFQYYDKGAMLYGGAFRDFILTKRAERGNIILTTSLSGGYTFGNKFRGTNITPDNSFKIIPALTIKWEKNPVTIFFGTEYNNSEYYKIGPLWFRMGVSYNYYFDNIRIRAKKIKWN